MAEVKKDLLEEKGFAPISERTFDSLFMKGWQVEGEESSDEEITPGPQVAQPENSAFNSEPEPYEEVIQQEVEESSNYVVEKAEALLDLSLVDPSKVNWFKYIVDRYLNEDASILNSTDAYANLLTIVLSQKKNEEI